MSEYPIPPPCACRGCFPSADETDEYVYSRREIRHMAIRMGGQIRAEGRSK